MRRGMGGFLLIIGLISPIGPMPKESPFPIGPFANNPLFLYTFPVEILSAKEFSRYLTINEKKSCRLARESK